MLRKWTGTVVGFIAKFVLALVVLLGIFHSTQIFLRDFLNMQPPMGPLFPPLITMLILFVYARISRGGHQSHGLEFSTRASVLDYTTLFLFVVCVVVILAVPPTGTPVYLNWAYIDAPVLIKALASILVTLFIPGYAILRNLSFRRSLSVYEVLTFSYVLSIFLSTILAFGTISMGLEVRYTLFALLLAVITLFGVLFLRGKLTDFSGPTIQIKLDYANLFVITLLIALVLFSYSHMYNFIFGDQWTYHGQALLFYRNGIPPAIDGRFAFYTTWWFALYLATFLSYSGLPSANAYYLLNILNPILLLAFYTMLLSFFERRKDEAKNIPIVATVFALFAGLGWIYWPTIRNRFPEAAPWYVLSLLGGQTYDVWVPNNLSIIASHPDITTPLQLVALPALFLLLCLLGDSPFNQKSTTFAAAMLGMGIFASHVAEMPWLLAFLIALTFLPGLPQNLLGRLQQVNAGILLSLILTAVVDVISPFGRLFTIDPYLPILLLSFAGISLALLIGFVRKDLAIRERLPRPRFFNLGGKFSLASLFLVAYIFGLSFVIVANVYSTFHVSYTIDPRTRWSYVPWYFYPMRLGVVGLLAIAGLAIVRKKLNSEYSYQVFLVWSMVSILLGMYVGRISHSYDEFRFTRFLGAGLSIFASVAFIQMVRRLEKVGLRIVFKPNATETGIPIGRVLCVFVITSIILTGMASTLLYTRHQRKVAFASFTPRDDILGVANFISPQLGLDDSVTSPVVTDPFRTGGKFDRGFCLMGMWDGRVVPPRLFFDDNSPEQIFLATRTNNLKYIYMKDYEREYLSNDTYIRFLLNHLPVAYADGWVSIFESYNFAPPTQNADLRVLQSVDQSADRNNEFVILSMLSLASVQYEVSIFGDADLSHTTTLLVPFDPPSRSRYTDLLLDWVKEGGNLVYLGGKGGIFESNMEITISNRTIKIDGVRGIIGTTPLPTIEIPEITSHGGSVLASYTLQGDSVSPFVIRESLGRGNLFFMHLYPIVQALESSQTAESTGLFESLGELLLYTGLNFKEYEPTGVLASTLDFLDGAVTMEGNVTIRSDSIHIDDEAYPFNYRYLTIYKSGESIRYGQGTIDYLFIEGPANVNMETDWAILQGGITQYNPIRVGLPNRMNVTVMGKSAARLVFSETDGASESLTLNDATIEITDILLSNATILFKAPIIEVDGITHFSSAWLHEPAQDHNVMLLIFRDEPFELSIQGKVKMAPYLSSPSLVFLSDFYFQGTMNLPEKVHEEWNLPWLRIFRSSISLGYHGLFACSLLLVVLWRRKRVSS